MTGLAIKVAGVNNSHYDGFEFSDNTNIAFLDANKTYESL